MANNTTEINNTVNKVTLYSYSKVWNVEKKIYALFNLVLPAPINPYLILVYIVLLGIIMLLEHSVPFLSSIPVIIRYLVLPYGGARYLMKKKLDGKNPLKYLFGLIFFFLFEKGRYIEKFKKYPKTHENILIEWKCSKGQGGYV